MISYAMPIATPQPIAEINVEVRQELMAWTQVKDIAIMSHADFLELKAFAPDSEK